MRAFGAIASKGTVYWRAGRGSQGGTDGDAAESPVKSAEEETTKFRLPSATKLSVEAFFETGGICHRGEKGVSR